MGVTSDAGNMTDVLNELIETCIDGQKGFESAANAIDENPSLKSELMGFSDQRGEYAADLQNLVAAVGETPRDSGSVAATLHRGWLNLREAVSSRDAYAILAECERGEDSAVAEYRKALDAGLPTEFARVIERQFAGVVATHDRVKALRDAMKPSS